MRPRVLMAARRTVASGDARLLPMAVQAGASPRAARLSIIQTCSWRLELGEFSGEHIGGVTGRQSANIGDGDRFEGGVRAVQDLKDALLGAGLVQAKQRIEGGAANVGRLGRREQALVDRRGGVLVARTGQGVGAAKASPRSRRAEAPD